MKPTLFLSALLLMSGCDSDRGSSTTDVPDQVESLKKPRVVDFENACAEIYATRNFQSSKRMDILKSYGFTPTEASSSEEGFKGLEYVNENERVLDPQALVKNRDSLPNPDMYLLMAEYGQRCLKQFLFVDYSCPKMLAEIAQGNKNALLDRFLQVQDCIEGMKFETDDEFNAWIDEQTRLKEITQ